MNYTGWGRWLADGWGSLLLFRRGLVLAVWTVWSVRGVSLWTALDRLRSGRMGRLEQDEEREEDEELEDETEMEVPRLDCSRQGRRG